MTRRDRYDGLISQPFFVHSEGGHWATVLRSWYLHGGGVRERVMERGVWGNGETRQTKDKNERERAILWQI